MAEKIQERLKRLLSMVPFVVQKPGVTVDEVCARFSINREQLTQDLNLLFVCGQPPYSPGDLIEAYIAEDQVVIRAAEYFKRPPKLTPGDGLLLYVGAKAMSAAGVEDAALGRAMKRLEELLGTEVTERVSVELEEPASLRTMRDALQRRKKIHLRYYAHSRDDFTERDVDPLGLFSSAGHWYLIGWCHLARGERMFRLDRVLEIRILDEPSEHREEIDLTKYEDLYVEGPGATEVVIDLAPKAASWVRDYYPLRAQEELDDGWIRVKLSAGGTAWLVRLLVRLGSGARVVGPEELSKEVTEMACGMAETYR